MKFPKLAALSLLALAGAPALAQTETAETEAPAAPAAPAAEVAVGTTIYGPQGNEVGKITQITDGNAVIDTGTNSATLPISAFGRNEQQQPVISMTKEQLDTAVAQAKQEADAKLAAALVPGAAVQTSDGVQVGTVKEIDAQGNVVVDRTAGAIALPKNQFTTDANGAPALLFTDAQLKAALGGG